MERTKSKLRNELLNREIVDTLLEAKVLIERWRQPYSQRLPRGLSNGKLASQVEPIWGQGQKLATLT